MKSWYSIKWDIHHWLWSKSKIYINSLNIMKCYREWKVYKKWFKKPSWKFIYSYKNRFNILRFEIHPLQWKSKYGEPRHEEDPTIMLSILWWTFTWRLGTRTENDGIDSMIYWETILWMYDLEKKYSGGELIYKAIKNNTWTKTVGDKTEENAIPMLTVYGKNMYDSWVHHLKCEAASIASN